jgi:MFS family permease
LQEVLHASPGFAVLGYAGFSITMALGRLCGDWLNNRLGQVALVLGGSLMAILGLAMVLLPMNQISAVIGFCCVGMGVSNIVPIAFSAAGKTKDLDAAPAIAVVALLGYFGLLLGPALIGFAAEVLSLRIALGLLTILLLAMILVSRGVVVPDAI